MMVRTGFLAGVLRAGLALSVLGGAWFSAGSAVAAEAAETDTPEAAFDRYRALINTHDFDKLAEFVIAPDALFVFTDKTHRGMDEVRAAFNRTWSILPDEVYSMTNAEWLSKDENSALVVFRYSYRGTTREGKSLSGGGHGTNLYKRTPAGWRLVYEHLSHDPKPAAPAS